MTATVEEPKIAASDEPKPEAQAKLDLLKGVEIPLPELYAAKCRKSFPFFCKLAWNVLEPTTPLEWNWHLDCLCVPGDTEIATESGMMTIQRIVETKWSGRVLSYSHDRCQPEWRPVTAWFCNQSDELLKIYFDDDRSLEITADHPVFVDGKGYIRANEVEAGDIVFCLPEMPKRVPAPAMLESEILQQGVLRRRAKEVGIAFMSSVRRGEAHSGETLQEMQRKTNEEWHGEAVRGLRSHGVSKQRQMEIGQEVAGGVLQYEMPVRIHDGQEQCELRSWDEFSSVSTGIQEDQEEGGSSRMRQMFSLRGRSHAGDSPLRHEQIQQYDGESGSPVPILPRTATPKGKDREGTGVREGIVRSVERAIRISKSVYNIEVEGNNNYFANGLLVHNCSHIQVLLEDWISVQKWRMSGSGNSPRQRIRNLIFSLPPGSAKSRFCSVFTPAWMWLIWPTWRASFISGNPRVTLRDADFCRQLIDSDWYRNTFRPQWRLSEDQNAKSLYRNTAGGFRAAFTSGSKITGDRSDCVARGTMVATEHGDIPIEDVKPGMMAWSLPPYGDPQLRKVLAWKYVGVRKTMRIGDLQCTLDHKILCEGIAGRSYIAADDIRDEILWRLIDGKLHCESRLEMSNAGGEEVYDIQVEENHNFFAGGICVSNCLIVDDANDADEVSSEAYRDQINNWWDQAARNRVNDMRASTRLLIGQRLHVDDLIGHVLKTDGKSWESIVIPQEYRPEAARKTVIGWRDPRKVAGELMFPSKFPAEELEQEKKVLGPAGFSAQHQQNPQSRDSNRFKSSYFRYWKDFGEFYELIGSGNKQVVVKNDCWFFAAIDPAGTDKKQNKKACYTVLHVWAVTPQADMLLLHEYREQVETPTVVRDAASICRRYNTAYLAVEKNGIGLGVVQNLKLTGINILPVTATSSKEARSEAAEIRMAAGKVFFQHGAPYIFDLESELLAFPNGDYLDRVDALAWACDVVQQRHGMGIVSGGAAGNMLPDSDGRFRRTW